MLQSTKLDSRTVLIRADAENDLSDLFVYLKQSERDRKANLLNRFLEFADDNYATDPAFKFNREECYVR